MDVSKIPEDSQERLLGLCGGPGECRKLPRNSILDGESERQLEGRESLW